MSNNHTTCNLTTKVEVLEVSTVDEAANLRKFAIFKATKPANKNAEETEMPEDENKSENKTDDSKDALAKAKAKLEQERQELAKARESLTKEVTDLKTELAKVRDEKLETQYIAKAKTNYPNLPGTTPEEMGVLLKTLHMACPEEAVKVEEIFKAYDAAVNTGTLLDEKGTPGTQTTAGSAWEELEKRAKAQLDANPALQTMAKATRQVLTEDPDLYARYCAEQS